MTFHLPLAWEVAQLGTKQNNMKTKLVIAITGGIGSGKSLALATLDNAGYQTFSSDKIVSELYQKHSIKKLLKKMFPTAVSGRLKLVIDKTEIAKITFNDKQKHTELTNAITPLVLKQIQKKVKSLQGVIFVEVPLLFECSYQDEFDKVLVVVRDKNARIESVKVRSNLTTEQVLARMNNQVDYDAIDLSNYIVVTNDGDKQNFEQKVLEIAKSLETF